ncbi:MAG: hypothetical protein ACRDAQ_03630 [Cetobacterium sp.]
MKELKPIDVINLCKTSDCFYKEGIVLFVKSGVITYKIYNVSDLSFENLKKKI